MGAAGASALGRLLGEQSRRRSFGVFLAWLLDLPVAGRWLAWLGRLPNQLPGSSRVTRAHAWLLRRSGRLRHSWLFAAGQPVLSLTTTGRKTGARRSTAVACFRDGDVLAIAGMNLGVVRDPSWSLNLEANPHAEIDLAGEKISVIARRAEGEEAAELWSRWVELQPSATAYRELAGREIPIFILSRR
jgi:deazaflavin-dependent oxidoreductase (nitroreductase family)